MSAEMSDAEKASAQREARESARSCASSHSVQQLAERAIRSYLLAQERRHRETHAEPPKTARQADAQSPSRTRGKSALDDE